MVIKDGVRKLIEDRARASEPAQGLGISPWCDVRWLVGRREWLGWLILPPRDRFEYYAWTRMWTGLGGTRRRGEGSNAAGAPVQLNTSAVDPRTPRAPCARAGNSTKSADRAARAGWEGEVRSRARSREVGPGPGWDAVPGRTRSWTLGDSIIKWWGPGAVPWGARIREHGMTAARRSSSEFNQVPPSSTSIFDLHFQPPLSTPCNFNHPQPPIETITSIGSQHSDADCTEKGRENRR
ncbi:hypothetical protein B0H17DRAFT_1297114 [Mycena rosella]|uniref:Uncharacterized protein n=1 Tax=Mycena rosella TaxID=1033263 RepID=A0AAD7DCX2_MYCRO|nr:hypothetical protein B0H17DRAFT_1297114 [Mycena rosella]